MTRFGVWNEIEYEGVKLRKEFELGGFLSKT